MECHDHIYTRVRYMAIAATLFFCTSLIEGAGAGAIMVYQRVYVYVYMQVGIFPHIPVDTTEC